MSKPNKSQWDFGELFPTEQIRRVLRTIADGGDQVLFTTHSPLMVDVEYFDEIVRIEGAERVPAGAAPGAGAPPHGPADRDTRRRMSREYRRDECFPAGW